MGQLEVAKFLDDQRKINDKWFTAKEITEALKAAGYTNGYLVGIYQDLLKLATFNMIECKGVGLWDHHKEFRAFLNLYKE